MGGSGGSVLQRWVAQWGVSPEALVLIKTGHAGTDQDRTWIMVGCAAPPAALQCYGKGARVCGRCFGTGLQNVRGLLRRPEATRLVQKMQTGVLKP
eukprot:scaffold17700_cov18-Tisochrysis_lutea.AAC.1